MNLLVFQDAPEVKTDLISEQLRSLPFKTSPLVIDLSVENVSVLFHLICL